MKLLITGANGQLGSELLLQLKNGGSVLGAVPVLLKDAEAVGVDIADADLANREEAFALVQRVQPDVVINCAAYTAVDNAETDKDNAFRANALAPRNLAMACQAQGAKLIHISTDYVFDGEQEGEYSEGAPTGPATVYGETKLLGEKYVSQFCSRWFVVRTAWLYGRNGGNFVKTMLRLADEKDELQVVNDQHGNPTNAEDLAHHLLKLAVTEEYGLYHCTGNGTCTWYDFTCEIVRLAGKKVQVNPCTSEQFVRPARRPKNSALAHTMLRAAVGDEMRPWQEALAHYLKTL